MSKQDQGKEIPEGKPEKAIELLRETSIIWKTEQEKYPIEQALKLAYQEGFAAANNTSLKTPDEKEERINDLREGKVWDIRDVFEAFCVWAETANDPLRLSFPLYLERNGYKLLQPLQQGEGKKEESGEEVLKAIINQEIKDLTEQNERKDLTDYGKHCLYTLNSIMNAYERRKPQQFHKPPKPSGDHMVA